MAERALVCTVAPCTKLDASKGPKQVAVGNLWGWMWQHA